MTIGLTDDMLDWASRFVGLPLSRDPRMAASGAVAAFAGGGAPGPASFTGVPSLSFDGDATGRPSNQRQHHQVPTRVAEAPGGSQQKISLDDAKKQVSDAMAPIDKITVTYDVAAENDAVGDAFRKVYAQTKSGNIEKGFGDDVKKLKEAVAHLKAAADKVDLPTRRKSRDAQLKKITDLTGESKLSDLEKVPARDKATMIDDLLGAGELEGDARMLELLYVVTPLDSDFEKADKKLQQVTADKLKGDKALTAVRANWSSLNPAEKNDQQQILKTMQHLADVQSDTFGIDHVPVLADDAGKPKVPKHDVALFDEADNKIYVNLQNPGIKDFASALEVVFHENAHHWQHELVKKLEARPPKLTQADPLYNEARLFQANSRRPGGYVKPPPDPTADEQARMEEIAYEQQPVERHAIKAGKETARLVDAALQPAPTTPPSKAGPGSKDATPPPKSGP